MPFRIENSVEVAFRVDFSLLCNARQVRHAVEVGVDQGWFAKQFLERWTGDTLCLVDHYEPYNEMIHDRTGDLFTAVQALAPYHGRFRFYRCPSEEGPKAIEWFIKPTFIYIDADHEYTAVYRDLNRWWDRLEAGPSIFAGHDYDNTHPGVMKAVNQFGREKGLIIRITSEKDIPASWYTYKEEPPTLHRRYFTNDEIANPALR